MGSRLLHTQVRAHAPTAQGRVTEGESKSEGRMKERCNIRKGRGNEENWKSRGLGSGGRQGKGQGEGEICKEMRTETKDS